MSGELSELKREAARMPTGKPSKFVPGQDLNEPINKKLYIKRQWSKENTSIKIDHFSEELLSASQAKKLPNLILNDKKRSTSYNRLVRSSDLEKVKHAPIATRLIYNWSPLERLSTKIVQAKVKLFRPKKRIETTTRAPSPYKIHLSWETSEPNLHNELRAQEMKRIKYMQDHSKWSVYPYGSAEEKEEYNKTIRENLKQQMEQKVLMDKRNLEKKFLEFKFVSEQDRLAVEEDRQKKYDRLKYLSKFRDENKQLMEDRWLQEYLLKRHEWQRESELLRQDPVNWSKTLR